MLLAPDVVAEIDAFLGAWRHVTLATAAPDGQPQAAVIGVAVAPGRQLVFDTLESTRKYLNLINNPRVAVTIGWDDFRTIQLEGLARKLAPDTPEHESLVALYLQRFPDGNQRLGWPGICHFAIAPTWLRYSDYRSGPRIFELDAHHLAD